ncbi:hypothetical protein [Roseovarius pacificus]|uniref:hypothetical protein n=1 Tax=Roseovarius pacificus TaxID=337701 RepID=UPI004039C171
MSVRSVGIRELLEWAFQRELASLDFDEITTVGGGAPPGIGMEYIMMERAKLGCRVDGGGRSDPHPDAEIVASALAALPERVGGRRMAIWIAELARAGREPDWYQNETPRYGPAEWHINPHGARAVRRDAAELGQTGWPPVKRRNRKGVIVTDPVYYCPVTVSPNPSQIAAARRAYLSWWGALLELRDTFRLYTDLSAHVVTDEMPPLSPWRKNILTKS